MTSGQKVAFSLLISVLAFCAFTVVAFSGLFDILEVNFYQPFVQEIKEKKIDEIESAQTEYFDTLIRRFDSFAGNPSVKTYIESHPADSSVRSREILRSSLLSSTPALSGIRIISNNGRNLFFSTFPSDIISSKNGTSYRNYDNLEEASFKSVKAGDSFAFSSDSTEKARIIKEGPKNRIIISLPFLNSKNEIVATILFYCDSASFSQFLFSRNLIDINGYASLLSVDTNEKVGFGGFVFGIPNYARDSLQKQILEKWQKNDGENLWLVQSEESPELKAGAENEFSVSEEQGKKFCVFSRKPAREDFGYLAFLYDESELKFPPFMRILLLATAFVTFYLAFFLILSFKHDDIVIIRDKISRYQNEFFIAYRKMGEPKSAAYLLEQKNIVEERTLKSLGKKGEKHAAEFKAIFDSSWNELLAVLGGAPQISYAQTPAPQINAEELKEIVRSSIEDILKTENGKLRIESQTSSLVEPVEDAEPVDEAEPVEEIEDAEPIEELDEVDEAEELDDVEDAEAIEDAEEIDEVEELDEVEDAEDVESLDEVDDAEEVDEAEEIEDAESVDEVEELDDAEPVEELDEVEDLDFVDKDEPSEASEPVDNEQLKNLFEPVENIEELNKIEDAEPADEEDFSGEMQMDELLEKLNSQNTPSFDSEELSLDDFLSLSDALNAEADNEVFKEELGLGIIKTDEKHYEVRSVISEFRVYKIDEEDDIEDSSFNHQTEEEIEELTEEVILPKEQNYFTMTTFTAESRFYGTDLPSAEAEDTIVENNGVYSITDSLEYSDVVQDPAFKALVDSVLHQVSAL